MGKSTILFIFENAYLNNIFVEAASCVNASKLFCLQNFTVEKVKKNNLNILVTDNLSLTKMVNQDIKPDCIFLVNESNQASSNLKISSEVININIPFKMSDIYRRIENYLIQIDINNKRISVYTKYPTNRESKMNTKERKILSRTEV